MERLAWESPPPEILSFEDDPFPTIQGSPHLLQSSVMPVVVCRPGEVIQIGTCFSISASGILVTADHVFLEGMEITGHRLPERVSTPEPKTYQLSDDDWRLSVLYSSNIMPKGPPKNAKEDFLIS